MQEEMNDESASSTCAGTCDGCAGENALPLLSTRRKFLGNGFRLGSVVAAMAAFPSISKMNTAFATAKKKTAIVKTSKLKVGGAYAFTDPTSGVAAYVIQPKKGTYAAFSRVCPHAGCTVSYSSSEFKCPCHGSEFNGKTGAVIHGPATKGLTKITISESNGEIYAG